MMKINTGMLKMQAVLPSNPPVRADPSSVYHGVQPSKELVETIKSYIKEGGKSMLCKTFQ
jgi:hypothetical protein